MSKLYCFLSAVPNLISLKISFTKDAFSLVSPSAAIAQFSSCIIQKIKFTGMKKDFHFSLGNQIVKMCANSLENIEYDGIVFSINRKIASQRNWCRDFKYRLSLTQKEN